jgi:hypothetical protein
VTAFRHNCGCLRATCLNAAGFKQQQKSEAVGLRFPSNPRSFIVARAGGLSFWHRRPAQVPKRESSLRHKRSFR